MDWYGANNVMERLQASSWHHCTSSQKCVCVCGARQAVRRIRSTDSTTVDGQTLRCSLTVQIERKAAAEVLGWKAGVANS